jgi:hypothetical protein
VTLLLGSPSQARPQKQVKKALVKIGNYTTIYRVGVPNTISNGKPSERRVPMPQRKRTEEGNHNG